MPDILQKVYNSIGQKRKIGFKALPRWLQVVERVIKDMFSLFWIPQKRSDKQVNESRKF